MKTKEFMDLMLLEQINGNSFLSELFIKHFASEFRFFLLMLLLDGNFLFGSAIEAIHQLNEMFLTLYTLMIYSTNVSRNACET